MGNLKSSKFVFDLRKLQKQDLPRFMQKELRLVKDGNGDSAVFLLPQDIDISLLEKTFCPAFSLAHVEVVAVPQQNPYQILRLESQANDLEKLEVE